MVETELMAASPLMRGIHDLFARMEPPVGGRGDLDGNPGLPTAPTRVMLRFWCRWSTGWKGQPCC